MAHSDTPKPIHPSIVVANDLSTSVENIPIRFNLKNEGTVLTCNAQSQGSLQDLREILADLIDGANESCQYQYQYELADHSQHLWQSLEAFDNDNRLKDYNEVAVFCCPISYLKEHNARRPHGRNATKFISQISAAELENHTELRKLYGDIASTEAQLEDDIIIFETLRFAAKRWLAMVKDITLAGIPSETKNRISGRGGY